MEKRVVSFTQATDPSSSHGIGHYKPTRFTLPLPKRIPGGVSAQARRTSGFTRAVAGYRAAFQVNEELWEREELNNFRIIHVRAESTLFS